jgi:exodeoxyribonuclease VII large subunit
MDPICLPIADFNTLLKEHIEQFNEHDIWITGEISQLKFYSKGNQYYFYLSDKSAAVNCVLYGSVLNYLKFNPENNQHVFARGKIKYLAKKGSLLFQISYMGLGGIGKQSKKLDELKAQLEKEGLFAPEKKQPLPQYPEKIGVITSLDSAAMWDFVSYFRQSNFYSEVNILPSTMQGDYAALSIIENIDLAHTQNQDVLVIIRGGGSSQELGIFNNETLVRNIANSEIPIITGIGHQIDSSLADLAADVTCATPTATAHVLANPFNDLKTHLSSTFSFFNSQLETSFLQYNSFLAQSLDKLNRRCEFKFNLVTEKINYLTKLIDQINPLEKLKKGYSISTHNNQPIKSISSITKGDTLITELIDGTISSTVKKIAYANKKNVTKFN